MKKIITLAVLSAFMVTSLFAWTQSNYGTEYDSIQSMQIRETLIDSISLLSAQSVTRTDVADIVDISIQLYTDYNYRVSPYVILAIIGTESNYSKKAISCSGAKYGRGLMQVSEIALMDYNIINKTNIKPAELFDPYVNIKVGMWIFLRNLDYGVPEDVRLLFSAYNLGAKKVKQGNRNIKYENKVIDFYYKIK